MGQLNPLISQALLTYVPSQDPRGPDFMSSWRPQGNDYENKEGDFLADPTNAIQPSELAGPPLVDEEVESSMSDKLKEFGLDGVSVMADTSCKHGTIVQFSDNEGDSVMILFSVGDDNYPYADVISKDPGSRLSIDLSTVHPSLIQNEDGTVDVDLSNLDWMNKTTLTTILATGHVSHARSLAGHREVEEKLAFNRAIILGGQVMKLPIVTDCNLHPDDYNSVIDHIETNTGWPVPKCSSSDFYGRVISRRTE